MQTACIVNKNIFNYKREELAHIDRWLYTDSILTYSIEDFPYYKLNKETIKRRKKGLRYIADFMTFDIESTTVMIGDKAVGFMYHWQADCQGLVVTGRTWEEYFKFLDNIKHWLGLDEKTSLVVFVHNLGYEYYFMYQFLAERSDVNVFASKSHHPLRVDCSEGFEFRCSYMLSNMSLYMFCKDEQVEHPKAIDDLDYKKIRTPKTKLESREFGYCVSDVVGLREAIQKKLAYEHDTLDSMPMTSTGYVRRACRNATRKDKHYRQRYFNKMKLTPEVYQMLKAAGRGGNVHANRYMSGRLFENVFSFDFVSSYPAQILLAKYPMTKFENYGSVDSLQELLDMSEEWACLFTIAFTNLKCKDTTPMPYISRSKCEIVGDWVNDNGRVLSCDGTCVMTITDIDLKIILKEYTYDSIAISNVYRSKYGYLPEAIRSFVYDLFKEKCELKEEIKALKKRLKAGEDVKEQLAFKEYLYGKCKNRLNGVFGMMYTDICHDVIVFDVGEGVYNTEKADVEESIEKYYRSRNNFLQYQWGVWTTVLARQALEELLEITGGEDGQNVIYCDTDSSKCINPDFKKIEEYNKKISQKNINLGVRYTSKAGNIYDIGLAENETGDTPYVHFKTLGAKKYAYEELNEKNEPELHITISGVVKGIGAKELKTIDNFAEGFAFVEAGGVTLHYNPAPIHVLEFNGEKITTASNVGMTDSSYTLGLTQEYKELLKYLRKSA